MAIYNYVVVDQKGNQIEGKKEADNKDIAVNDLLNSGYNIITISEDLGSSFSKILQVEIGGLPLKERVLIAKQMATMISAGIPLIQAIDILRQQFDKQALKDKFDKVYRSIEGGNTLSSSFEKVGGIFSNVQINLIAAGEKSGNLNEMLIKVSEDMEKSKKLRGKITGALIYPVIIFFVLIIIVAVMLLFMIPQVQELYASLGQDELPPITELLISMGNTLSNPIGFLGFILSMVTLFGLYRYYNSTDEGKFVIDKYKMKIPVFGNLIRKIQLTEFSRLMAMLIQSGIPIIEAIEITTDAMGNEVFRRILDESKSEISKGIAFSLALARHNVDQAIPLILIRIIATGEEAGKLELVLDDMSKFYEEEVNQVSENLTKLMEPFILVVVGGLVAFLAIAIYLPIYQVGNFI